MKTYYNLLAIAIAILSCTFISCKNDSANTPDQPKRHISRPDSVYIYVEYPNMEKIHQYKHYYQYDLNGNTTQDFSMVNNRADEWIADLKIDMSYNERGLLATRELATYFIDEWHLREKYTFEYDEDDQLIAQQVLSGQGQEWFITYTYTDDGKRVGWAEYNPQTIILKEEVKFNTHNDIVEYMLSNQRAVNEDSTGSIVTYYTSSWEYDMYGNVTSCTTTITDKDNIHYEEPQINTVRYEYTYDKNGDIIKYLLYTKQGNIPVVEEHVYFY